VVGVVLAASGLGVCGVMCWRARGAEWGSWAVNVVDGFLRLFCRHYHRMQGPSLCLPTHGPAIVVANHVSGLDPFLLIAASPRPLRFLMAREEYERFGLRWLFKAAGCIPVDRDRNPARALRAAAQALQRGEVVAVFPQGGIRAPDAPRLPLKGGAIRLAKRFECMIHAVHLRGVRRVGHVVTPLLVRGKVCLDVHSPFDCREHEDHLHCLRRMEKLILKE